MTPVGRVGGEGPIPPIFTGPVVTGVPGDPRVGGAVPPVAPVPPVVPGATPPALPDVALAGRLAAGDVLPDAAALALALEQATRALQGGRAHEVLATLDATWSSRLAADSPWYLRAAALELLARRDDAAGVLREALARLPRSAALLYLLGVHAVTTGDMRAADVASEHAVALHPDDPVLLVLRAAVEGRRGRPAAAESHLARAEARAPGLPVRDWFAGLVRLATSAGGAPRAPSPTPPQGARTTRLPTPTTLRALAAGTTPELASPTDPPPMRALRRTPAHTDGDALARTLDDGDATATSARRGDEPATSARARRADDPRLPEGLHDAVRYGLALLDPPAIAARAAVRHRTLDEAMPAIAAQAGLVSPPVRAATPPGALALVVAAAVLALAAMPSPRTLVGAVVAVAALAWWWGRRDTRSRTPVAREALRDAATTVDRRIA